MKELDLLLQRWLAQRYEVASEEHRARFAALLELPDPDLAGLLLHGQPVQEPDLAAVIREVLSTRP
jgi:succinate dehydrogenase flavin-adding protein (antitoxin of CptAB toxin-antitoxin module)